MREKRAQIEFCGKTYDLLYNVVAMAEVNERYGGIYGLKSLMTDESARFDAEELPFMLALLINQSIALDNLENNTNQPSVDSEWIRLRMEPYMRADCLAAIIKAINLGNEGPPEDGEVVDEVLAEIEKKSVKIKGWRRHLCSLSLWACKWGLQKSKRG